MIGTLNENAKREQRETRFIIHTHTPIRWVISIELHSFGSSMHFAPICFLPFNIEKCCWRRSSFFKFNFSFNLINEMKKKQENCVSALAINWFSWVCFFISLWFVVQIHTLIYRTDVWLVGPVYIQFSANQKYINRTIRLYVVWVFSREDEKHSIWADLFASKPVHSMKSI